ncbi:MAG: acetate--CoA ligase family protein [Candidatus Verstraetearchaeota archaeon]|nr:acetate--CoA ligase family protein [Candidatus Verstraetearchaeota archaeon]
MSIILEAAVKRGWMLEPEAKELCREFGLPVGEWVVVSNPEEALEGGRRLGFPLALKLVSPDVLHKSDVGGVALNVGERELVETFNRMKRIAEMKGFRFEGVLMERMAPPGVETIIGAKRDPQFGPVVMFGLGGIFVEVFRDVSFRIAPIERAEAEEMLFELKAYPLLKGVRGRKPSDTESLVEALLKVSRIMERMDEIREIDLNPVIVYEKGCRVVDARVIFK